MAATSARARRAALLALIAVAWLGCGAKPTTDTCPNDLPAACPASAPSYAQVTSVLAAHCVSCHSDGGVVANRPLSTLAEVQSRKSSVLDQTYSCNMPPAGEPTLSTSERTLLLTWLVCGAPP